MSESSNGETIFSIPSAMSAFFPETTADKLKIRLWFIGHGPVTAVENRYRSRITESPYWEQLKF